MITGLRVRDVHMGPCTCMHWRITQLHAHVVHGAQCRMCWSMLRSVQGVFRCEEDTHQLQMWRESRRPRLACIKLASDCVSLPTRSMTFYDARTPVYMCPVLLNHFATCFGADFQLANLNSAAVNLSSKNQCMRCIVDKRPCRSLMPHSKKYLHRRFGQAHHSTARHADHDDTSDLAQASTLSHLSSPLLRIALQQVCHGGWRSPQYSDAAHENPHQSHLVRVRRCGDNSAGNCSVRKSQLQRQSHLHIPCFPTSCTVCTGQLQPHHMHAASCHIASVHAWPTLEWCDPACRMEWRTSQP
jgi:hypothetical protein